MNKIKCCYVMCKFNNAVVEANYQCNDDFGYCTCKDEIVLGFYECKDCGNEDDGMDCKNYISKSNCTE